jgi:hypothetical protein
VTNRYALSTWIYGRLLGLVTATAFVSLWVQIDGLVGSRGLVPAVEQLSFLTRRLGDEAAWAWPTLAWLSAGDAALHVFAAAGTACGLLMMAGLAPRAALLGAWLFYLSLVNVGGPFTSFQWDSLLLETLVMSALALPLVRFDAASREPPRAARWLVYWLLFRLMFASGAVKLASDDPTWADLTALTFHYETQPLPNPLSYHVHWLSPSFHRFSCAVMFALELGAPFLVFVPHRHARRAAFVLLVGLQLFILLTGNYGFFNLLSIALCVPLLDDALLLEVWPKRWRPTVTEPRRSGSALRHAGMALGLAIVSLAIIVWSALAPGEFFLRYVVCGLALLVAAFLGLEARSSWQRRRKRVRPRALVRAALSASGNIVAALLLFVSTSVFLGALLRESGEPMREVARDLRPFRSINRYGLFAVMTTERDEIILEGSHDGTSWQPYEFPYKPGTVERAPPWVPLGHMPRLDWQMWFAALGSARENPWLARLMQKLLEGEPDVVALLEPFGEPPRFVRAIRYRYHFATPEERAQTGHWWRREDERIYAPSIQRP